jgi:hypothetical protein
MSNKKLPYTSDLREIERRMISAGVMRCGLIWDSTSINQSLTIASRPKKTKGRRQAGKPTVKNLNQG